MSRLKQKITPSLRKALEKIGENVESIPGIQFSQFTNKNKKIIVLDEDSPHFLPRWDFSQSTEKVNITLYVKLADPDLCYCDRWSQETVDVIYFETVYV